MVTTVSNLQLRRIERPWREVSNQLTWKHLDIIRWLIARRQEMTVWQTLCSPATCRSNDVLDERVEGAVGRSNVGGSIGVIKGVSA